MNARTADESNDQGEIVGELRRVADMLPPPDQLVLRGDTVKVNLAFSRRSIDFFKSDAVKQKVHYRRIVRGSGRRVHAADGVSRSKSVRGEGVTKAVEKGRLLLS